jgi:hypothetical protein
MRKTENRACDAEFRASFQERAGEDGHLPGSCVGRLVEAGILELVGRRQVFFDIEDAKLILLKFTNRQHQCDLKSRALKIGTAPLLSELLTS